MDVQLSELLEKIKEEGIKPAEEKAKDIIASAEKRAEEIVKAAQKEAADLKAKTAQEIARMEQSGKEALKQAGRDLLLNVEKRLQAMFAALIEQETKSAFSAKALEEAIVAIVKAWNSKKVGELKVLLSPEDIEKVEKNLVAKLSEELKKGMEIKPSPNVDAGFLVSEKDGSAYYNFSSLGIAELLSEYLNPKLAELLREAKA